MQAVVDNRAGSDRWARLLAVVATVGHFFALVLYVLFPMLVAPPLAVKAFAAAWVVVLGLTLLWYRHHPWRTAVLPIAGAVVVGIIRILGEQHLGWRG
jgi:hypothetical protein